MSADYLRDPFNVEWLSTLALDPMMSAGGAVIVERARDEIERLRAEVRKAHGFNEDAWDWCTCGETTSPRVVQGDETEERQFWFALHAAHVDAILNGGAA